MSNICISLLTTNLHMEDFGVDLEVFGIFIDPIKQSLFCLIRAEVACFESCRELIFGRKSYGILA